MANPVVHFEIGCRDRAVASDFFGKLFDWRMEEAGPATLIRTGGDVGGHFTSLGHEPHNFVTVYVAVDDVGAYLAKAESLGGKRLVGPVDIPAGTFAWFSDPDGNIIALWKDAKA
jgi:predicted enzyme related to lactoylglutathione lyase